MKEYYPSRPQNNGQSAVKYCLLIDADCPQIVIGGLNDRQLLISNIKEFNVMDKNKETFRHARVL